MNIRSGHSSTVKNEPQEKKKGLSIGNLLLFAAISGAMGLLLSNLCTVIVGGIFALIICCIICVGVFLMLVTMFDTAEISLLWKNLLILRGGKNAAKKKIKPSCR